MEFPFSLLLALLAGAFAGWMLARARAERHFATRETELRARLDQVQREIDERVLRIKQLETQRQALDRQSELDRRRIGELELEIGRLRMRIVDLEARERRA
jgi:septal ring factor EnvC (AmiA/AmiB activator)